LKPRTQAFLILPIIVLLVGSVVIFNSHSFSLKTEITTNVVTDIQTSTQFVTQTVQSDATKTVFFTQPPISVTVTSTIFSTISTHTTTTESQVIQQGIDQSDSYVLVGGQNGTWFNGSQFPRLLQISISTHSIRKLNPVLGQGTVWSGDSNGSDWLISGWGADENSGSPNPYLYLFNGSNALGDQTEDAAEAEWNGGDVFSISSNGSSWFLSGMGSGVLDSYSTGTSNHFSAGLFNGTVFTDLSSLLPEQMDGILYSNAFGNNEWLVGGGYLGEGVLFSFNGTSFTDLTSLIASEVPEFHSIQSIAWNGKYWLIGGMGFLAMYNNSVFTDLTPELSAILLRQALSSSFFVNSVAWNGSTWLIGGGDAVAMDTFASAAWLASYGSAGFADLSGALPINASQTNSDASVLSIASSPQYGWLIGGYIGNSGMLLSYDFGNTTNLSGLTGDMSYVTWVGPS
jgi:hypothetical protein